MENKYDPKMIEKKWQDKWDEVHLYHSDIDNSQEKFYAMTMLPYPSGDLHIGHWYAIAPSDARARFKRMQGYNVMFPMGFDAFGLPAENAAIKRNIHPKEWTYSNIDNMRRQLRTMGTMIDWRREAITADEKYYKWNQWFFLQFFKNNLAYRKKAAVDWCPSCNTTLAREQVWGEDRVCERCGTQVIKKELEQWFFKTTQYAEELLIFDAIDWPERVITLQTNWIGRSEGASVIFKTEDGDEMEIFTTRPDTLWGATFMVLAPEHPLVQKVSTKDQKQAVGEYILQSGRQSDIERESIDREKTGVFTGGFAINPVNGERIPIWIADYVLMSYGTGAIMAVPAHDQRDFDFARKYGLEIRPVILPEEIDVLKSEDMDKAVVAKGRMINSGELTGTPGTESIRKAIEYLDKIGSGKKAVNFRLRDWLISRQRYWGTPIPMIHCENCGIVPVPEDQLPVALPEDIEWRPTGESPLKFHPTWKFVECPECGGDAIRDTDTMDTFMCSSWYHLRYLSPDYKDYPFDQKEYDYWMPVDLYTGGIEHATMHLIYTRVFHKFLRDLGITEGPEPMGMLRNQGMVLGEDHEKMSKSRGNVIAPDELVDQYGSDTVRAYLMFFARWDLGGPWDSQGIEGSARWVRRVWNVFTEEADNKGNADPEVIRNLRRKAHQTLKSVTKDFEELSFNTIVSSLMELLNTIYKAREDGAYGTDAWKEVEDNYLRMMAPVCPHITEEIWQMKGKPFSIHTQPWPEVDEEAAKDEEITLVVQVNGKLRDRIQVPVGITEEHAKEVALTSEAVKASIQGKEIRKIIVIKGQLVNIVV
ncbi:MAG: leucine--tRNA ligase [Anaerolineales bacterium]|nr:leucine--tRNA ligase [Anaerolineales bacterium]